MDTAFPRTFGDANTPTRPHAPEDSCDALDAEALDETLAPDDDASAS